MAPSEEQIKSTKNKAIYGKIDKVFDIFFLFFIIYILYGLFFRKPEDILKIHIEQEKKKRKLIHDTPK